MKRFHFVTFFLVKIQCLLKSKIDLAMVWLYEDVAVIEGISILGVQDEYKNLELFFEDLCTSALKQARAEGFWLRTASNPKLERIFFSSTVFKTDFDLVFERGSLIIRIEEKLICSVDQDELKDLLTILLIEKYVLGRIYSLNQNVFFKAGNLERISQIVSKRTQKVAGSMFSNVGRVYSEHQFSYHHVSGILNGRKAVWKTLFATKEQ